MSKCANNVVQPAEDIAPSAAETPPAMAQHEANGQFAKGNKGGPGNPFGRKLASMRQAILRVVTEEQIERIMGVLMGLALEGNVAAAKLVLQYAVGKPQAAAEPDRVEVDDWELQQKLSVSNEDILEVTNKMPIRVATLTTSLMRPHQEEMYAKGLRGELPDPNELTEEEIEEMKRQKQAWAEEDAAEEAMIAVAAAERGAAASPSINGFNGDGGPSLNGFNGGPAAERTGGGAAKTVSAGGSPSRRAS